MATAGAKGKAVDVGHLQHAQDTSSVGGITTTETVTDTITATLEDGCEYDIYTDMIYNCSAANSAAQIRIREDSGTSGNSLGDASIPLPLSSLYFIGALRVSYTATASGSKTFTVTCVRPGAASGTVTRYGAAGRPAHVWLDKTGSA
jgi:hypothetical protein